MFKDRKRLLEWGKNLLIVLLIGSALLMARESGVFGPRLPIAMPQSSLPQAEVGSGSPAALPYFAAVVGNAHGGRWGAVYDEGAVISAYNRFSAVFGEALGSADEPVAVSEEQWRSALGSTGVYLDYLYPQPLPVLAGWLGTEVEGGGAGHSARRFCLAIEGNDLALYYIEAAAEDFYRCDTALSASSLASRLQEYSPNGALFVWELGEDAQVDSYALMGDISGGFPGLTGSNPLRDTALARGIPELFGLSGAARSYSESNGVVFVENEATIRVLNTGTVLYRCSDGGPEMGGPLATAGAVVEAARALCQRGPGACCGAAKLGLSAMQRDKGGDSYTLAFDYSVGGVPLRLPEGSAVELTVVEGRLRGAVLHYRSYALGEGSVHPLPRPLALAAVRSVGGGESLLAYMDSRKGVELQWLAA